MKKIIIRPSKYWKFANFEELWEYRELLYFLVWRNIRIRYSQAVIGVLWVILQPIIATIIFTIVFGRFAKFSSEGLPYSIFVFSALLPWNLFSSSITGTGSSLIINRNLVTKVYFPRILIPISKVLESVIDFFIACTILFLLMSLFRVFPGKLILFFPLFFLWLVILSLGVGFWLSALNVKYRDVTHIIPFLVQIWLYSSPIVYTLNLVPQKWHWIYAINPMVGIIEGFRWSLLGRGVDLATVVPISFAITCLIFITGWIYFRSAEKNFADII